LNTEQPYEKELLERLVSLRDKAKKNKKLKTELKQAESDCLQTFDYLVDLRTRRYKGFSNYDDLRQDGRIALCRALQTYKPEKGDFFWWCNKYIKTKISREANRHSTIKIPLKHAQKEQPYKVTQLPVIIDEDLNALENITRDEVVALVRNAVEKLPEEQRKVITLHYELSGSINNRRDLFSIGNICKQLNISRMSCIKLLSEAKKSLRKELVDAF
jgi:RNA polymerase sigma factor (sigma-70 family)